MKKIIIIFLLSFQIVSCQERTVKLTPKEFVSKVEVPNELYSKDSLNLVGLIKAEIKDHKGGYHSKAYDEFTEITIDTIVYSPDYNRVVFFIIDKIENKKAYPDGWTEKEVEAVVQHTGLPFEGYHYNAKAYIGIRKNDTLTIDNFFGLNINGVQDINKLIKRQRQLFFEEYAAVDEKGYEYNVDDKRFWDNPNFWDKLKRKKEKRKSFEETKKNNPENVYEPKKH